MSSESRRCFLRQAGQVAVASVLGRLIGTGVVVAADSPSTLPALASRPSTGPIDPSAKSVVARIRAREVIAGQKIHHKLLGEMIEEGIRAALALQDAKPADAWNALLAHNDVIGIKFNQVGAEQLATTVPMAIQLVRSLGRAGFAPEKIILIEVPDKPEIRQLKTRQRVFGWSGPKVSFGSGEEQLDVVLQEITAIINVPFLKTHNIAGMTGCLKNLSHALIRRPKLYHANGCTPYVGDIIAMPQIRSKLKVHIVNALRAVFDGGPAIRPQGTWEFSSLLVSTDPVAADAVGTDLINDQRSVAKLPPIGDANGRVAHTHDAAQRGLGIDDQDYIDLKQPFEF